MLVRSIATAAILLLSIAFAVSAAKHHDAGTMLTLAAAAVFAAYVAVADFLELMKD